MTLSKKRLKIDKIVIEKSVANLPLTAKILQTFEDLPVEFVEAITLSKIGYRPGELIIAQRRGRSIKNCPGTPVYQCCDYYVLNLGIGCFFNCHYCFLHHYMNSPLMIFANLSDLIADVQEFCARRPKRIFRVGSGEFVDSLGLDEIVDFNTILVPELSRIPNLLFEIKTKSKRVEHLLKLNHKGRVVVSWSLNPQEIIDEDEPETDSLIDRIKAAAQCQKAGYRVGFHFDPMIHYNGWEAGYSEVIDMVFSNLKADRISWISLGALRFNAALKPIIKKKFPESRLILGELVPGLDKKLRYFLPIRRRMFAGAIKRIRSHTKDVPVYLCMEDAALAADVGASRLSQGDY